MENFFKRQANRLCVYFDDCGFVPLANELDDTPKLYTSKPLRVGDDAVIFAEGKMRKVRLLKSSGPHGSTFLVDIGPCWS